MIIVACCVFSQQACNTAHRSITGCGYCMLLAIELQDQVVMDSDVCNT
jgi:hypothetical protein